MFHRFFVVMVLLLIATVSYAFEGEDLTCRNVTVAAQLDQDENAVSAVTVIPVALRGGFIGFAGNDTTKLGDNWDVISRVQLTRTVGNGFSISVFGEHSKQDSLSIDRQIDTGLFVSKVGKVGAIAVTVGAGNFLQQERERTDLNLDATDARTVRALVYTKLVYRNLSVLAKATPKVDGKDIRVLVNPEIEIGNGLSISTEMFYDSDPAVDGEEIDLGATITVNTDF